MHKLLNEAPRQASAAAAANRSAPVLARLLRNQIDAIIAKTLHKSPRDRYASAALLGADIAAHLGGTDVSAAPPSPWQRLRLALRQRWREATTAALLLLVLGLILAWQAEHRRLQQAEQRMTEICRQQGC